MDRHLDSTADHTESVCGDPVTDEVAIEKRRLSRVTRRDNDDRGVRFLHKNIMIPRKYLTVLLSV